MVVSIQVKNERQALKLPINAKQFIFAIGILSPINEKVIDFISRCVASFMARMGQCFSTSIDTVGIEISQGVLDHMEEDVKTTDQEYTFSDGVGRISQQLVTEV